MSVTLGVTTLVTQHVSELLHQQKERKREGNLYLVWACLLQIQIAKTTFRITQGGCPRLTVFFGLRHNLRPNIFSVLSSGNPATIIAAKTITRGRYFCFGDCNPR